MYLPARKHLHSLLSVINTHRDPVPPADQLEDKFYNRQCESSHRRWVPAVVVPVIHCVESLQLRAAQLPGQELGRGVLFQVLLVDRLWNHCAVLLQGPPQKHLTHTIEG